MIVEPDLARVHGPVIDPTDPESLTSMLGAAEFGMWGKF